MHQVLREIRNHYRYTMERWKKHRNKFLRSLSPAPYRYPVALAAVMVSVFFKLILGSVLGIQLHPYLLSSATVMFAAWYGGLGAGMLATILSILVESMFFMTPNFTIFFDNRNYNIQNGTFFIDGVIISILSDILRSSRIYAEIQTRKIRHHELKLIESEKALRRLNAKKDEFINVASHELKTPLTSTILLAQVLNNKMKTMPDTPVALLSRKLMDQVIRLNKLVTHLLDASRIQSGKLPFQVQPARVDTILEQSIEEFQGAFPARQIRTSGLKEAYGAIDPERIKQVIGNLLSNAAKYSPKEKPIYVTMQQTSGEIIVHVKDFGHGIPDDQKKKIFSPYYRMKHHQSEVSGMGLGLYIAETIIISHGGTLWVKSELGKGSTFSFSIPRILHSSTPHQAPNGPQRIEYSQLVH